MTRKNLMAASLMLLPSFASSLAGCSETRGIVVVQNPKTGEVQQCVTNPGFMTADAIVNQCAAAYESIGWKRVVAK